MISRFRCLSGEIKVARILHFFVIAKVERGVPTAFNSYIELRSALRSAVAKAMSDRTSMSSLRHELRAECSRIAACFIFDKDWEEDVIQTIFFFPSTHTRI